MNCRGWKEVIKPFPTTALILALVFQSVPLRLYLSQSVLCQNYIHVFAPAQLGKMNTSLPGWCERPEDKWLILCLMPSTPKRSILLYCPVPPIHHGIRDLQWGKNLDSHLARATCIWTSAQPFTSNIRWCVCVCVCTLVA